MELAKRGRSGRLVPFAVDGIHRDRDGLLRFNELPPSFTARLRESVDLNPGAEAVVEVGGERLSYRETWDRAARVAGGLREAGVRRGDRVAIHLPNGVRWTLACFGTILAGGVLVPVNTRFAPPEVEYVVGDCEPAYTFKPDARDPEGKPFVDEAVGGDDPLAIFYTSGTTGFPKGALITHVSVLAFCENLVRMYGVGQEEAVSTLISVPMFHITGSMGQLFTAWCVGGRSVILPRFDVDVMLAAIGPERIDYMVGLPAILWLATHRPSFESADVSSVTRLIYGGAPTAVEMVSRLGDAFPAARLFNSYGATETGTTTTLPAEWALQRPETVGIAGPVCELDLWDIGPDGVGELVAANQPAAIGYWRRPVETAETFTDGWVRTGDLARIDDDGFVQIVDRSKDMINRGGENVYCVEVENALIQHPGVLEVAVVGVPDRMMGEVVGAVITPRPGTEPDAQDVRRFVSDCLADYKVPEYVSIQVDPLPRNAAGKLIKGLLRERDWGPSLRPHRR